MNKIEKIKKLLKEWKANQELSETLGCNRTKKYAEGVFDGLTLALVIEKEPSNKVNAPESEPCDECSYYNHQGYNYCAECGTQMIR